MRVITANVNGIRAAARKGFFAWLATQQADVVCVQETKAQLEQLQAQPELFFPEGFHCYYHDAEKKGYSGVALYCRQPPDEVITGMGDPLFDREGRYLEARFGNLSVASLYLPSGSAKEERQAFKYRCMDHFENVLQGFVTQGRDAIIGGDWNIVHTEADIRNWKSNQKRSGCLPEERAWLDKLFQQWQFVDALRELEQPEHTYTWWSNRGQAWDNNVGWRIDYQVLTPSLKGHVAATSVYKSERFSDHAPLIIDYRL